MATSYPHIAVAILNYNGAALMANYLPSVLQSRYPNFSVWIIDNASTDPDKEETLNAFPSVKWVQLSENGGYAKGYNEGLQQIDAEYYLLLNNDVRLAEDTLDHLATAATQGADIVQPKLLWDRHPGQFEYAGAAGGLVDGLGYPFCYGRMLHHLESDHGQYELATRICWASGACMLIKAALFRQLGGFYDYFFMHQEEIDLCWRAGAHGAQIVYMPQAKAWHLGGASLGATNPRKTYFNFRNNLVMISRNMPYGRLFWVLPFRLALDAMAALVFLVKKEKDHAGAVAKGWLHYLLWVFSPRPRSGKKTFYKLAGKYSGSLLWQVYVRGRKSTASFKRIKRWQPKA